MPHDVEMPDDEPSLASYANLIAAEQKYVAKQAKFIEAQMERRRRGQTFTTREQQTARGRERAAANRKPAWTKDSTLAALRAWHEQHGSWPSGNSWEMSASDRPTSSRVRQLFGSWAAAIEEAQG